MTLAEVERQTILRALESTRGNKRAAAQQLGIQRSRLYAKIRKYKIEVARQPGSRAKPGAQAPRSAEAQADAEPVTAARATPR
jgi:hypothetical protein